MDKYLLAKAKNDEVCEKGECGGAVTALLQYLLDQSIVDGVLNVEKRESIYDGVPAYVTDSNDLLKTAGSLHCAPTMTADLVARYLKDEKIAITTKPCDAMGINEIIKRHGIDPDNIYQIGLNCGGTVLPYVAEEMIQLFYETDPADVVSEEIDKGKFILTLKDGSEKAVKIDDLEDEGFGRRENCQRCELKIPRNADIACGNWGSSKGYTFIETVTEKGAKLVEDAEKAGYIETKAPKEKMIGIRSKVEKVMIKLAHKNQKKQFVKNYPTTEGWDKIFSRCLKCYRCRDVCPVCNSVSCSLEKPYFFEDPSEKPDPLLMHGIRLGHMSFSCVNCGQCEDACPMDIPIARMYQKVEKEFEDDTGYISGVSEGKPPVYSPNPIED